MQTRLCRITRRILRTSRLGVLCLLVTAQTVVAFGSPLIVSGAEPRRPCGCPVGEPSQACCCGVGSCCERAPTPKPAPKPTPKPEPKPTPPLCPHCIADSTAKPPPPVVEEPPAIVWVYGVKARQCRGEGPLGLMADIPTIPPLSPVRFVIDRDLSGREGVTNQFAQSIPLIVPIRPPRIG